MTSPFFVTIDRPIGKTRRNSWSTHFIFEHKRGQLLKSDQSSLLSVWVSIAFKQPRIHRNWTRERIIDVSHCEFIPAMTKPCFVDVCASIRRVCPSGRRPRRSQLTARRCRAKTAFRLTPSLFRSFFQTASSPNLLSRFHHLRQRFYLHPPAKQYGRRRFEAALRKTVLEASNFYDHRSIIFGLLEPL